MLLTKGNIIEMYKKGYSIDYIVKCYYREKTKYDIQNYFINDTFIVTKKTTTIEHVKKEVEDIILKFALSNKAN